MKFNFALHISFCKSNVTVALIIIIIIRSGTLYSYKIRKIVLAEFSLAAQVDISCDFFFSFI